MISKLFYQNSAKTKVICLCGSSKFKDEFLYLQKELSLKGYCVLSLPFFSHADNIKLTEEEIEKLKLIQFKKISMSNIVIVVNKNGYIGPPTNEEILFAIRLGKEIFYLEGENNEICL